MSAAPASYPASEDVSAPSYGAAPSTEAVRPLVCIGFAEALSAPEVLWSLVDAGYRVIAFARRGQRSSLRHSRHVQIVDVTPPEQDSRAALAEVSALLASVTEGNAQQVMVPLDDAAVWLSGQIELPTNWICACVGREQSRVALDKWLQTRVAIESGFRVPKTVSASTVDDVLKHVDRLPLILRSARAVWEENGRLRGGPNRTCANRQELESALRQWNGAYPVLLQPFIRGIGEGIFGIATSDGIQAWSGHRRIRMVNPKGSGSSACMATEVPADLREPVQNLIRQTRWRGIFMVEILRDASGTPWFVEFNGRSWGSMALSRRRGFEYPAWNVKLAMCPAWTDVPVQKERGNVVCRHLGRECAHLLFVLRGPRSKAYSDWPSFWRTLCDVLFICKDDSFYNWRNDDKAVFFTDWWYTIRRIVARGLGR